MKQFEQIAALLSQQYPGLFACRRVTFGLARGLKVRCARRGGFAFVFEPDKNGILMSLHEDDPVDEIEEDDSEVWCVRRPEDVVERIKPWAFPDVWALPQPIDPEAEQRRLLKLAAGLFARGRVPCVTAKPKRESLRLLTAPEREQLDRDLESVCPERLALSFPWDPAGRLELNTTVLLATYETTTAPSNDRDVCLAAIGPARRRDVQRIELRLVDLIVVNQSHRWERFPWLWQDIDVPRTEFLGTDLFAEATGTSRRKSASPAGRAGRGPQQPPESQRASQSLRLLDEGRIEDALGLYGVSVSQDLHRLLGGERIRPPACCAHPDENWTAMLVGALRDSAPWLLPGAVVEEARRLQSWAAGKKGRPHRAPDLKLLIFPGQHHQRKASLMLTGDLDGRNPRLVIEATATNARLPDARWKRPIAVDFLRRGVRFPAIGVIGR